MESFLQVIILNIWNKMSNVSFLKIKVLVLYNLRCARMRIRKLMQGFPCALRWFNRIWAFPLLIYCLIVSHMLNLTNCNMISYKPVCPWRARAQIFNCFKKCLRYFKKKKGTQWLESEVEIESYTLETIWNVGLNLHSADTTHPVTKLA